MVIDLYRLPRCCDRCCELFEFLAFSLNLSEALDFGYAHEGLKHDGFTTSVGMELGRK